MLFEAYLAGHGPVDPTLFVGNISVDSGNILLTTANTPGHDANLGQHHGLSLMGCDVTALGVDVVSVSADQRTSSIATTGISTLLSTSTGE